MGGRHIKGADEHAVGVAARAVGGRAWRVDRQLAAHREADVAAGRESRVRFRFKFWLGCKHDVTRRLLVPNGPDRHGVTRKFDVTICHGFGSKRCGGRETLPGTALPLGFLSEQDKLILHRHLKSSAREEAPGERSARCHRTPPGSASHSPKSSASNSLKSCPRAHISAHK